MDQRGDVSELIAAECDALKALLLQKNKAYGNSALDPVRIFSKANPVEQVRVRIDDKLSRLMRGSDAGEDTIQDLLGYLILLRVAQRLRIGRNCVEHGCPEETCEEQHHAREKLP